MPETVFGAGHPHSEKDPVSVSGQAIVSFC